MAYYLLFQQKEINSIKLMLVVKFGLNPISLGGHVLDFDGNICFQPLFQWNACGQAKLSTCTTKCMTDINKIYFFFYFLHRLYLQKRKYKKTKQNKKIIMDESPLLGVMYFLKLINNNSSS